MNKSILSLTLSEIISLKPLYKLQPFYFINNPLLFFGLAAEVHKCVGYNII